jgi:hypothetical protein
MEKCIAFLEKNGFAKVHDGYHGGEYQMMSKGDETVSDIDISEDEIVFIGDGGDWLRIPCNFYALIGACIHHSILGIGYRRP